MITIGYSTRVHNPEFMKYIKDSSGFKKNIVIEKVNDGSRSLSAVYNEILKESETDIVVFCHDDIYFDTKSWYSKLIKHFDKSDYGILGVAGTTSLPSSGMWWENKRKMLGIVNHEYQGKKWESKYSNSSGNEIDQCIVVDGLFIAINKKRIKCEFQEFFEGFHFYDVSFCFENYLKGVKIGVISNIRITHKSIGMTNESWQNNRKLFSNKFADKLPVKLPNNPNKKLKILISCLSFRTFTGSEIYVYELAKNLLKMNCDVTILSQMGGPLTERANKLGIKCLSFENLPGYKLGDGVWGFNNSEGFVVSEMNKLYKVNEVDYDIIHMQHTPVAEKMVQLYPEIPKIYSIHSEVIPLETPIIHDSIQKYIAIRPEIKNYLTSNFKISDSKIEIIYNPIDDDRFNLQNINDGNYVLFVGTIDYLRQKSLFDLVEYTEKNGLELWVVGQNKSNYLESLLTNTHVKHFESTWNTEKYVKNCKEVAGIQLGRTTIEGWMCGKSAWIYNVNDRGDIISKNLFYPPEDVEDYKSFNVSKKLKSEYLKII